MDDLMTLMIFAFLALMVAGVLFALYFFFRGSSGKREAPRQASRQASLVEAARLLRDKPTGMLLVALDGKLYAKASELSAAQRQRMLDAEMDLQKWLGQPGESPAPRVSPPAPAVFVPASPPPAAVPADLEPATPVKPVSTNPVEALRRTTKPAPAAYLSIIGQIDALLQGMLEGTPLAEKGVSLAEASDGGVLVCVGMNQYAGIDEVPDDEVRKVIRAAVAEWEKLHR